MTRKYHDLTLQTKPRCREEGLQELRDSKKKMKAKQSANSSHARLLRKIELIQNTGATQNPDNRLKQQKSMNQQHHNH